MIVQMEDGCRWGGGSREHPRAGMLLPLNSRLSFSRRLMQASRAVDEGQKSVDATAATRGGELRRIADQRSQYVHQLQVGCALLSECVTPRVGHSVMCMYRPITGKRFVWMLERRCIKTASALTCCLHCVFLPQICSQAGLLPWRVFPGSQQYSHLEVWARDYCYLKRQSNQLCLRFNWLWHLR